MDTLGIIEIILGFIGGGGVISIISVRASRRKANAEADATVIDNYEKYTTKLETRMDSFERKVDQLTEQNNLQYKAIMAAFGCKLHSNAPGSTCPVQDVYESNKADI